MPSLLSPSRMGAFELPNRVVMAPMTRSRADARGVINASAAEYYALRADAGLIVTEGVNVGPMSNAFERAPGLWTEEQTEGWRAVVDRVHQGGGRIVAQLWHGGRASARGLLGGREPLSPSGIDGDLDKLQVWGLLANGAYVRIAATPSRAMNDADVARVVEEHRVAAANARRAGFDGVEIHGANGYLIQQFLSPVLNRRSDEYGGSVEGRTRLLREITAVVSQEMSAARVGLRLSPFADYNDARDPDPEATYASIKEWLSRAGLAYLHVADTNAWTGHPDYMRILDLLRPGYDGALIVNGGISPGRATSIVEAGEADAVAFGRLFLANPDLLTRIERGGPYNALRHVGQYGGGNEGYLDYPILRPTDGGATLT